jgi:hypothetical protein
MRHVFAFLRTVMAALAAEGPNNSGDCTAATAASLAEVVSLLLAVRGCEGTATYIRASDVVRTNLLQACYLSLRRRWRNADCPAVV